MNQQLLTISDVAELVQCSSKTVKRAIDAGHLRAAQLAKRGTWRIRSEDVDAWIELRSTRTPTPPHEPARIQIGRPRRGSRGATHGRLAVGDDMGRKP